MSATVKQLNMMITWKGMEHIIYFFNSINNQYICRLHLPYHEIKKFMVFEECLLVLFKKCRNCGDSSTRITTKTTGTFLGIIQNCSNCCYTFKWDSQPVIGSTPVGNILLSASILFSGATPTKVLRVLQCMDVPPYLNVHILAIKVTCLQFSFVGITIKLIF